MAWNYADEESLIEHIRKLQQKQKKEMLEELEESFVDDDDDYEDEYETYVKYIVSYRNGRLEEDFKTLEIKVNKFIESQRDSFILEGPVQLEKHYLVQTLINEDEM